jgi:hypothetical protein
MGLLNVLQAVGVVVEGLKGNEMWGKTAMVP